MTLIYTVLIGVAAYRIWRLVAIDDITEDIRSWRGWRWDWVYDMIDCPWCLGTWCAFGLTWVTDAAVGLRMPVLVGLAAAVVTGWLGDRHI